MADEQVAIPEALERLFDQAFTDGIAAGKSDDESILAGSSGAYARSALAIVAADTIDPAYGVATNIVDRARAVIVKTVGDAAKRTTGDRKWLQVIADDVRDGKATDMPSYLVLDCVIAVLAADRLTDTGEDILRAIVSAEEAGEGWADAFRRAKAYLATHKTADAGAMRSALQPFLRAAEPILHNDRDRWDPDEWHNRLNNLTVGQFRALHAAAIRNLPDAGEPL